MLYGEEMNEYKYDDITIGTEASFVKTVTPEMEDAFRTITGDENPLHKDDLFAVETGEGRFKSHVSFGMLTASLYSTLAGVYLPGKYSLIHSFEDISFTNPVYAGDELTVSGKVIDKTDDFKLIVVKAMIKNGDGKTVSKAKIKIIVMK